MSKKIVLAVVAIAATLLSPGISRAQYNDVLMDTRGGTVRSIVTDSCVLTRWDAKQERCPLDRINARSLKIEERTIYFPFNSDRLEPSERAKLDKVAPILMGDTEVESIKIVGHADRIGADDYNMRLSERRAKAVKDYLISKGYTKPASEEIYGVGESSGQASCRSISEKNNRNELIACLARERRVEIEIHYMTEY